MNKKLIKKYKKEFDYWLEGGDIIAKFKNGGWVKSSPNIDFSWAVPEQVLAIVIDDEYVEFRKALAEGKTIQHYNTIHTPHKWTDVIYKDTIKFSDNISYRIKPEEPEFKVGDWICQNNYVMKIDSMTDYAYHSNDGKAIKLENAELWKPQPCEWCWFWNDGERPTLGQFVVMSKDNEAYRMKRFNSTDKNSRYYSKYCEPFIGELPTALKETNNGK